MNCLLYAPKISGMFYSGLQSAGMDKGDIPDLTKAPGSLLEALESHMLALENKKPPTTTSSQASNATAAASTASYSK